MAADIVGYSARMERAEEETAKLMLAFQDSMTRKVESLGGRVFSRAGDSAFAEFSSPVNAVVCAVNVRNVEDLVPHAAAEDVRPQLRIGVHLADVIVTESGLTGDGVNITARIQQSARPDDIWVSESLFNQVRRHSPFSFEDLGPQRFKNISEPIRVFRLAGEAPSHRYEQIHVGERPASGQVRESSIAVMPFAVLSADEELRYLADGLTEDIIVELSRFRKLKVVSCSASFAYEGKPIDPGRVGRELGVRYVLEGRIRGGGNSVLVSLKLMNCQSGETIWADRIVRPVGDAFEVIEVIVQKVAATVVGRVEAADMEAVRRKPPSNLSAYDCVLRGLEYHRMGGVTDANQRKAVEWFDRAIEADRDYGVAYAWRICAASNLPDFNFDENFPYIQRALELDENNAEAHRIMGNIYLQSGNLDVAEHHLDRAMRLSPSDAYIKAKAASLFTYKGDPERALALIEEAQALDPFLPAWSVAERGVALYALDRFEESHKAFSTIPFSTERTNLYDAAALAALGRIEAARAAVTHALTMRPTLTTAQFMQLEQFSDQKRREELRQRVGLAGLPPG